MFVSWRVTVTCAPGTIAPLESVTMPEIVPVSTCAIAAAHAIAKRANRRNES
jgi:hypothetical protein